MDVEASIYLSDLLPALRWSRPEQVAEALTDPRLPDGWWRAVPLTRALARTGVDWMGERLAGLTVTHWEHLPLADVLPALQTYHAEPGMIGWAEPVRVAGAEAGGWNRLRRLSAADLAEAAEPVIGALFRDVLTQLQSAQRPGAHAAPPLPAPVPASPARPEALAEREAPTRPEKPEAAETTAKTEAEPSMIRVVDSLFRSFDQLELAVAVHRLFAADPVSLRELAHRALVDRDTLSQAQRTAEERVLRWLRSSDSTPVTGHMFRLTEWLGTAATEEQLIGADPEHPAVVPSLRTPLWRVLVALMPDRRLQDGWLLVGDLRGLQQRTRRLLSTAPHDADKAGLLGEIGIRPHSAAAWLAALPPESQRAPATGAEPPQSLPRRTPGANGHHHRGGRPVPRAPGIDPDAAMAALSALSGGRPGGLPERTSDLPDRERKPAANGRSGRSPGPRDSGPGDRSGAHGRVAAGLAGMPAPTPPATPLPSPATDPRRWQRIDVTPEHLRGGPVTVPEGYATQLGMRPGTLLSVTGPGDNAVVLVWPGDRQPVFDSLQPVLMRLNARPGDQVYVTVDGYRLEAQLTA